MYANDDINIVGNIGSSANISARTRDYSGAYALYADSDLTVHGNIDGTITADANQYDAYALYAYDDINIVGNISRTAHITATAGYTWASGLESDNGSIYTGAIDGNIVATAGHSKAYGLRTWSGSITTGAINGNIVATAGHGDAYGLRSGSDLTVNGNINGTITANANQDNAYGLRAYGDVNIVGGIGSSANISATASKGSDAYGLYAGSGGSDLIIHGDIDGTISASAPDDVNGYDAYALYAYDDINIIGDIGRTAHITATAGVDRAYGLFSEWGNVTVGAIDGNIVATAGGEKARGLFGWESITTGAINGNITATAGEDNAAGLFSGGDLTTGDVNGTITATAGGSYARGLFGGDDIRTGAINGKITATAGDSDAAGLYTPTGSITTGAINGKITATAGGSDAAGLYSENGSITTGAINGTITAKARKDYAAGLWSDGDITTGAINGTISAETLSGHDASALYSDNGDINIVGDIGSNARITATARTYHAFGLYGYGDITTGAINGTIIATAGENEAAGLWSDGDLTTGAINGTIRAEALTGSEAYALYAGYSDPNINIGDIGSNALIKATARYGDAYGLKSYYGSITTGAIYGTITAEATDGDNAYAMYSWSGLETGNIGSDAHITATAGEDYAAGLYSENGSLTTGNIAGTISATADRDRAYGLYSNGPLTTGNITGTISAHAGRDYAYGIMSHGPMDVTIAGGTVSAVADDGTHAVAIQSGNFDDVVNIAAGSTIVGDIDLASTTDNDTMTLSGINTRNTTLNDDVLNVENINITGGQWYINGDASYSSILMSGGILSGTGNLGGLNVTGGTLAPGGSIGTMTVNGNLTLGSGSTFVAEVANDETADKVVVTGAAAVNGTIQGKATELIKHSFTVPVIDAATGLTGSFSTKDTAFLRYNVSYDRTNYDVLLNVRPTFTDFSHYATTSNQRSVGNALNDLLQDPSGCGDDVIEAMYNLPDGAAVRAAYNQMMPQDALGQSEIIRNAMNQYSESVFGRMDNIRNGGQYAMSGDSRYLLAGASNSLALRPKTNEWMPFAKGFGVWGDRNGDSDIAGYQYNIYGLAGGVDKLVSENTLFGLSVGGSWANVDYSQPGTSANIDSAVCSLYGSYFMDDWHLGLTLGYGHSWYDSQRGIPFIGRHADSDHQGNAYSAAVELGNNFGGTSMILEPVVGLGYTVVQEESYKEKGADALNLKVDSDTTDGIYSKLGIRLAKELKNQNMTLVPNVRAFWIHDFADRVELSSSFIGGGSFTTEGLDPVHDMFNIGAGLNVYYNKNLRLFVDYGWQSASSFNSNTVQLGAQWSF
jgi:uncharacterized protein with beta-barrel porin domain